MFHSCILPYLNPTRHIKPQSFNFEQILKLGCEHQSINALIQHHTFIINPISIAEVSCVMCCIHLLFQEYFASVH